MAATNHNTRERNEIKPDRAAAFEMNKKYFVARSLKKKSQCNFRTK